MQISKILKIKLSILTLLACFILPTMAYADVFYQREQMVGAGAFTTDEVPGGGGGGTVEEPAPEPEPEPEPEPDPVSIVLNNATLPDGSLGTSYSYDLSVHADVTNATVADLSWGMTMGAFPDGMSIDPSTGFILGTPTSTGSNAFDIMASFDGASDSKTYMITINGVSVAVQQLSTGEFFTCGITDAGGVKCWGWNNNGALGDGYIAAQETTPTDVVGLSSGVSFIDSADKTTCAVLSSGAVKCWGQGDFGETGDGTLTDAYTPVDVVGLSGSVTQVALGTNHVCALLSSGGVECWGDGNSYGQSGVTNSSPAPVPGWSSGVSAIAAGGTHTCVILDSGSAQCMGENGSGQLGNGNTTYASAPVDVLLGSVADINGGESHTCAVTTAGAAACWGSNAKYTLGDGTTTDRSTPITPSGLGSGIANIAASAGTSCAVTTSGAAKCWGYADEGATGSAGNAKSKGKGHTSVPTDVPGLSSGVTFISGGQGYHNCAVMESTGPKCWGLNVNGQLGNGSTMQSYDPVNVVW